MNDHLANTTTQASAELATRRTRQLLRDYLPPIDDRTPAERLKAIAGKALHDGRKKLPPLTPTQLEDAYAHLLEIGLRALTEYDPDLDPNPDVPLDRRFGRFAYLRMRQRLIDWHRKHVHDPRPGKTDRRTSPLTDDWHDRDHQPDFSDLVASADRTERWSTAATILGFDVTTWILTTLDDQAATIIDSHEAA